MSAPSWCIRPWRHCIAVLALITASCDSSPTPELLAKGLPAEAFDSIFGSIGQPDYEIIAVELAGVAGGLLLRDGRVAIAEKEQIYLLDGRGQVLGRTGREGSGPGEYKKIAGLSRWAADSIAVTDEQQWRVTIIGPDGIASRTMPLRQGSGTPAAVHWLGGGGFALPVTHLPSTARRHFLWRDTVPLYRYSADGEYIAEVSRVFGQETYVSEEFGLMAVVPPPQQKRLLVGASAGRLVIASPDSFGIQFIALDASEPRRLQAPIILRDASAELIEQHRNEQLARYSGNVQSQERLSRLLDEMPSVRPIAYLSRLLVDLEGNVWVGEYAGPGYEPKRWLWINASGGFVGAVAADPDYRILDIANGRALLLKRDDLGVDRVYVATVQTKTAGVHVR